MKKIKFSGMPDMIVLSALMIASFFFPFISFRYQKAGYTLSGLDLIRGCVIDGEKMTLPPNRIVLAVLTASVFILAAALISVKEKKKWTARIASLSAIAIVVLNLYYTSNLSSSIRQVKRLRAAWGSIFLMVLAILAMVRALMVLKELKVLSALDFMAMPGMLYFIINNYIPMAGIVIAFKKVDYAKGIFASPWAGLSNFKMLFQNSGNFFESSAWVITRNTILYNLVFIFLGILTGVIVGICLAGIANKLLQKFFQTSILLPQLISYVIVAYIVFAFLSNETGLVNHILGEENAVNFYATQKYWPFILVFIHVWKQIGYNGIIFLSSIVGIDKTVLEAARVDGCSKWKQLRYVTLPLLKPTIITLTMLQVGRIFYSDFGLFFQVPLNSGALYEVTDTVDTYVYRMLMTMNNISVSSAASTYQAVVGFVIIFVVNMIVRRRDPDNALF